jgi:5-methylcytosine-specific restriction endonuclease McrA
MNLGLYQYTDGGGKGIMQTTKICTKCGEEKLLTDEYFYRSKKGNDCFIGACKACISIQRKKYYIENSEHIRKRIKNRYDTEKEKILAQKKLYYCKNKAKIIKYIAQWQKENKKKALAYKSKYTRENKDKIREKSKQYYLRPEVKENINFHTGLTRAKKAGLPATLTKEEWGFCKVYFNYECAYCGNKTKLTKDHYIPALKGGGYTRNNILPACKSCNCRKNRRSFDEWYPLQDFFSESRKVKILKYISGSVGER